MDTYRSHLNFQSGDAHTNTAQKRKADAPRRAAAQGRRVRVVEALVTASPEFSRARRKSRSKPVQEALDFIREHQDPKTIISAVVHMDEKTPHMHLCFIPLTSDSASAPRKS